MELPVLVPVTYLLNVPIKVELLLDGCSKRSSLSVNIYLAMSNDIFTAT